MIESVPLLIWTNQIQRRPARWVDDARTTNPRRSRAVWRIDRAVVLWLVASHVLQHTSPPRWIAALIWRRKCNTAPLLLESARFARLSRSWIRNVSATLGNGGIPQYTKVYYVLGGCKPNRLRPFWKDRWHVTQLRHKVTVAKWSLDRENIVRYALQQYIYII